MTCVTHPAPAPPWLDEFRACLALSAPLVLTNAIEMAMNLTNTAMIGRIAPEALAAATLALALYNVVLLFGIGLTAAVSSLIAREVGRGDGTEAARRVVQGGFWNAAMIVGPIWAVLWQTEPILCALGQDPVLSHEAAGYLHVMQWSLLPALVYLVLRSMLAALQRPRWAVMTGLAAVMLNAVLNAVLIGGAGPLPALGLAGSGLAMVLSNLFLAAALGLAVTLDARLRAVRPFAGLLRPPWRACRSLWRLGLPIGIGIMLEAGMFTAAAALVGHFDKGSLAAHAIALQVASFAFMVPLGIAQAATVRVGRAAGAGDRAAVGRAGWTALAFGVGTMVISSAVLVGLPRPIIGLFLDAASPGAGAVVQTAVTLLALAALFQIADGAQVVLAGILRGLQDTRTPMLIAGIGYWGIGLPLAAALAPRGAAPGIWIGLVAGLFVAAGLLLARWLSWRRNGRPESAAVRNATSSP